MICIAIAVILFIAAFIAKRRFGLLGLALAAGYILSDVWGYEAGLLVGFLGININAFSVSLTMMLITVLPAIILLFHGYTYKSFLIRIIGAGLFALLAMAFLAEPLGRIVVIQGLGASVYGWLLSSKSLIIGIGLPLAVVDLFFSRPVSSLEKSSKH